MLYSIDFDITKGTAKDNPKVLEVEIEEYMIRRVDVRFPMGCEDKVGISLWFGEDQFFPHKRYNWVKGDGETVSSVVLFTPEAYPFRIKIKGFNLNTDWDYTVLVRIEALPEKVAKWEERIYRLSEIFEAFLRFLRGY